MDFKQLLEKNQARLRAEKDARLAAYNQMKEAGTLPPPKPKEKIDYSQFEKPKRTKVDHNARSKEYLEAKGYTAVRVDYFDTRTNKSHDFLGFGDILAMKEGEPPIIVQLTSSDHHATRRTKINGLKIARRWISTGGRILLLSFKKLQVGKNVRYEPREEWL